MKPKSLFSPLDRRKTFTLAQLGEATGIPVTTLREWTNQGKIQGAFRPNKGARWRFRREALEAWWLEMNSQPV